MNSAATSKINNVECTIIAAEKQKMVVSCTLQGYTHTIQHKAPQYNFVVEVHNILSNSHTRTMYTYVKTTSQHHGQIINMSIGGELFLVERPKIPQVENTEMQKLKGERK